MARIPNIRPFDEMAAGRQMGETIGRMIEAPIRAYHTARQDERAQARFETEEKANKLALDEKMRAIEEAKTNKKKFQALKTDFITHFKESTANAPAQWQNMQLKNLEAAKNVDEFAERVDALQSIISTHAELKKKHPNLSFQTPPALITTKSAERYNNSQRAIAQNSNNANIRGRVNRVISENPEISTEKAFVEVAKDMGFEDPSAVPDDVRQSILDVTRTESEKEKLRLEGIRAKAAMISANAAAARATKNIVTNKTFNNLVKQKSDLATKILRETNVDMRNLDDMGQFYNSDAWSNMNEEKRNLFTKAFPKFQEIDTRISIAQAARALGMTMDDTQTKNAYDDITDDGKTSTPEHQKIADYMVQQGYILPQTKEPGGEQLPESPKVQMGPQNQPQTDADLAKQIVDEMMKGTK